MAIKFQGLKLILLLLPAILSLEYQGCIEDHPSGTGLDYSAGQPFTNDSCVQLCQNLGYPYAATTNGNECFCGDTFYDQLLSDDSNCDISCTEQPDQFCGGNGYLSVFDANPSIQECYDHLETLNKESVTNECIVTTLEDKTVYQFNIDYVHPYVYNDGCLDQSVTFQGTDLPNQSEIQNEQDYLWAWNLDGSTTTFSIPHEDLEDSGCTLQESPDEYIWTCEMSLTIYYQGHEQFVYSFHMYSTLSRIYENTLNVQIEKNKVVGDCCENTLNVFTTLTFCEDFTCNKYLPDNLIVKRKQDIFVEHSIVSPEFQYYYLEGLQIKLGPFIPIIKNTDASQPGRIIYQFYSTVAAETSFIIEAISRISETPQPTGRRFLSEKIAITDDDDYKVNATNQIKVVEKIEKKDSDEVFNKDSGKLIMIIMVSLALVLLVIVVFLGLYCTKRNIKKGKEQDIISQSSATDNFNSSEFKSSRRSSVFSQASRVIDNNIAIVFPQQLQQQQPQEQQQQQQQQSDGSQDPLAENQSPAYDSNRNMAETQKHNNTMMQPCQMQGDDDDIPYPTDCKEDAGDKQLPYKFDKGEEGKEEVIV